MMSTKAKRLWLQVTADKKKFGLMVTMLAVGLLLWGRLILLEKVPRIATADPKPAAQTTDETAVSHQALADQPVVKISIPAQFGVDLFELQPDRYRPTGIPGETSEYVQSGENSVDESNRRQHAMETAREMTLQAVLGGANPSVMIDGQILNVGDTLDGFELIGLDGAQRTATLRCINVKDLVVKLRVSSD